MLGYKIIFGITAVAIGIVSYIPYIRDIFLGKTKPHAFSWFIWGVLTAIGFAASIATGGGAGAWVVGFTSLGCFFIAALGLAKGARTFPFVDWLALCGALLAIILWGITKTPTLSVIFVSMADAIGFIPTFRKGYILPREETAKTFALDALKLLLSIAALESYNISTVLYPASLVITNFSFVVMILVRRRQDVKMHPI